MIDTYNKILLGLIILSIIFSLYGYNKYNIYFYPTIENKKDNSNCIFTDPQCAIDVLNDSNDINKKFINIIDRNKSNGTNIINSIRKNYDYGEKYYIDLINNIKKIPIEDKNQYTSYIWERLLDLFLPGILDNIMSLSINLYTEIKLVNNTTDRNINSLYNIVKNYLNEFIPFLNNFLNDFLTILNPNYKKIYIKDVSNIYDNIDAKIDICSNLIRQLEQFIDYIKGSNDESIYINIQYLKKFESTGLYAENLSESYSDNKALERYRERINSIVYIECMRFSFCGHEWYFTIRIIISIFSYFIYIIFYLIKTQQLKNTEEIMNLVSKNIILFRDINKKYWNEIIPIFENILKE